MANSTKTNIMTIPCIDKSEEDKSVLPKLIFLIRTQQSKLKEICSFLDFLHFDVLNLSLTPNPEIGLLEAIYEMKRIINCQQYKLDMLSSKMRDNKKTKREEKKRAVYWLITFLFLLLGLKIIYLLPSQNEFNFQAETISRQSETIVTQAETISRQKEIIVLQAETILSQEEMISLLENKIAFYNLFLTSIIIGVSFGYYFLTGLKKKIQYQEKLIAEQIYQRIISQDNGSRRVEKKEALNLSLVFLGCLTLSVFFGELYCLYSL